MAFFLRASLPVLVGVGILQLACQAPAQAITVNVGGVTYELSVTQASYASDSNLFSQVAPGQMPWWNDSVAASAFAAQVYDQLGPNLYQTGYGAIFAWSFDPAGAGTVSGIVQNTFDISDQLDLDGPTAVLAADSFPYAIATVASQTAAVPAPLPLFGAAAAFGMSRRLRRRIQLGS